VKKSYLGALAIFAKKSVVAIVTQGFDWEGEGEEREKEREVKK
jgi:hypothetical protein